MGINKVTLFDQLALLDGPVNQDLELSPDDIFKNPLLLITMCRAARPGTVMVKKSLVTVTTSTWCPGPCHETQVSQGPCHETQVS